jgi:transcriptional regulator with XRE-family HTH domain
MVTVQCWTGAETKALRQAMRLSIRAFAAYLGIDARTVNKWEARHGTITLRPHTQELMDTALQRAPEEVKTRFAQTVSSAQQEQHGNAEPLTAPEHDPVLPPLSGNDDTDSLFTEEQPEGSQSHLSEGATPSPPLAQLGPVGDIVALFAANLALFAAATNSLNTREGYNELLTSLRRLVDRMNRRDLVQLFGLTATTSFVASWLQGLDPDEQERVVAAIVTPERVDAQVLTHIESVLFDSFVSNDKLGPRAALHTVLAQQKILQAMIAECPDELRPRLLSVFGNSLRLAGWVFFNAGDLSATRRYYEKTRVVAQDAQDGELATMVLANSSHVAESSGKPAISVDYAVAAQTWAARVRNPCLSAFASDIGACAFAAIGDYSATMRHLEGTQNYLIECSKQPPSSPFYRYSEALHVARRGQCLLGLGRTADAVQAIGESLKLYAGQDAELPNSHNRINIAMSKLDLSAAHVQAGDIDEGAATLADVGDFVSHNRADRLVTRVRSIRATLEPWQDTPAVKQLDDQLHGSWLHS